MRDCYRALEIDKDNMKSHFRLARCLQELKWHKEAKKCLDIFVKKFPDYANNKSCKTLVEEINASLKKLEQLESKRSKKDKENEKEPEKDVKNDKCVSGESFFERKFIDYSNRYCGHCNVSTDIKEASFIGT